MFINATDSCGGVFVAGAFLFALAFVVDYFFTIPLYYCITEIYNKSKEN